MPVVNGLLLPDIVGEYNAGFDRGQQRAAKSGLSQLMGDYYSQQGNDTLAKMAKIDPRTAIDFGNVQSEDRKAQEQQMVNDALLLHSAPETMRAQMYTRMLPRIRRYVAEAPEQYGPDVAQVLDAIAAKAGKGAQPMNVSPGGAIVDPVTGEEIYSNQHFAPAKPEWGYVPDPSNPENEVYARREGNDFYAMDGTPIVSGGSQGAPAAPQDTMSRLLTLGAEAGVTPTSGLRSPAHNAEVGGKPNSQHMQGTAMDYTIPPALKAQFRALVEKNPDLEVIDEGDHMHVQVRRGGARGLPGSRPRYKQGQEGGQYATLTAQEVKDLGLPVGTIAQRSPAGQVQIVNRPKDLPGAQGTVTVNEDGSTTYTPTGRTTEDQNKAAGWYRSSRNALDNLKRVVKENETALYPGLVETYGVIDEVKQRSRDAARQQVEQAFSTMKMDFLHAATGAGFTKDEAADEWRALAPQRGDTKQVIQQKMAQIEVKLESMRIRAGGALPQTGGATEKPAQKRLKYNPATGKLE